MKVRDILTKAFAIDASAADVSKQGAVFVGTAGNLEVTLSAGGEKVLLKGVSGFLPIEVDTVHTALTTADDIVILQ